MEVDLTCLFCDVLYCMPCQRYTDFDFTTSPLNAVFDFLRTDFNVTKTNFALKWKNILQIILGNMGPRGGFLDSAIPPEKIGHPAILLTCLISSLSHQNEVLIPLFRHKRHNIPHPQKLKIQYNKIFLLQLICIGTFSLV